MAHERYRRQTDDRQTTDGRTTTYSEHELEFTFAKNPGFAYEKRAPALRWFGAPRMVNPALL